MAYPPGSNMYMNGKSSNRSSVMAHPRGGSDVCMNGEWPCIGMDVFVKWCTEHILKHKISGKAILLLDETQHIAALLYCFRLLLKITLLLFVYRVTILIPYSLWISDILGL
jgi:hypothetical protein